MAAALNQLDAWQAARLLARREITAEALLRAGLERIAERESAVQAFTALDAEAALAAARALDAGPLRGALHGLPFGAKDIFDSAELPTACGTPIYAGHRPAADAASVALLRNAGAVLVGKTVTTELANMTAGATRNPHRLTHTPGGSSSGSAAAVADGMLMLALGTQTAGSIIRPAAYCVVVGYQAESRPRAGVMSVSEALDVVGGSGRRQRGEAPKGLAHTGDPLFCRAWSLLGLPCVHLPFTQGPSGLPVGLQLIGRHGDDHRLLAAADWVMTRLGAGAH